MSAIPCCVFAKPPEKGRVKTRLALRIGEEAASELATAMLRDVWQTVSNVDGILPVLAAACEGHFPIAVPPGRFWLQPDAALGTRITAILQRALHEAPAAIALGADSPSLTVNHLTQALSELERKDAVIGPCSDGGFYLLGLRSCPHGLLNDIPWSSAETCLRTVECLRGNGMSVAEIAMLDDVDTLSDLEALRHRLESMPPEIAPFTRQWSALSFQR